MTDVAFVRRTVEPTEPPAVAGVDFDQSTLTFPYSLWECAFDYLRERLHRKGKDITRPWISFRFFFDVVPPDQDVTTINESQVEDFVDYRAGMGRSVLTARKDLAFVGAAMRYAHRRHRIDKCPYIELPEGQHKHRRPMTEEEFRQVMRQPMSARLRKFYRLAYWTGARSKAIEDLTWERTDLESGIFDFVVPGQHATNKRRVSNFPIPDEALPILRAWKERATDDFVIGAGDSTYREAAYVVRELAGLTDPTLVPRHCMRKMFTSALFEKHADPEIVGKLTGDNPAMLRKHYLDFKDSTLRGVVNLRAA